jgi:hypothetical protein
MHSISYYTILSNVKLCEVFGRWDAHDYRQLAAEKIRVVMS